MPGAVNVAFEAENDIGGNLSSLGGYYNELKYFVDRLNGGEELEIAEKTDRIIMGKIKMRGLIKQFPFLRK